MVKSIWFIFTIHILEMNWTSHISIPSLKITWVSGLKRRTASLSVYLMRGWAGKPEGLCSLPAARIVQIIQELLAFDTVLKAAITEVETIHSIKIRNLSASLWDWLPGEDDGGGVPIPTWFDVGLMSPYTLAAVEKVKWKIYFLIFN